MSRVDQMVDWIFVLVQKDSNAKKEFLMYGSLKIGQDLKRVIDHRNGTLKIGPSSPLKTMKSKKDFFLIGQFCHKIQQNCDPHVRERETEHRVRAFTRFQS